MQSPAARAPCPAPSPCTAGGCAGSRRAAGVAGTAGCAGQDPLPGVTEQPGTAQLRLRGGCGRGERRRAGSEGPGPAALPPTAGPGPPRAPSGAVAPSLARRETLGGPCSAQVPPRGGKGRARKGRALPYLGAATRPGSRGRSRNGAAGLRGRGDRWRVGRGWGAAEAPRHAPPASANGRASPALSGGGGAACVRVSGAGRSQPSDCCGKRAGPRAGAGGWAERWARAVKHRAPAAQSGALIFLVVPNGR